MAEEDFRIIRGETQLSQEEFFPYLGDIAEVFTRRFPEALDNINNFDVSSYEKFTHDLLNMGFALSLLSAYILQTIAYSILSWIIVYRRK